MINAIEDRFSIRDERCQDQGCGRAQVGAHHCRRRQLSASSDCCRATVDGDIRAHPDQLLNVHETIFEDVLAHLRDAFGLRGEGHVLGLHIRGKAGVFLSGYVGCLEIAVGPYANRVMTENVDASASFLQLAYHSSHVRRVAVSDDQISGGDRSRHQKCSGFDSVWIDAVHCAVEFGDAFDADRACACSFNFGTHGDEQGCQIGHFRFLGAVLHEGLAIRQYGGHQQVFGTRDGDLVEDNVRTLESFGASFQIAVFLSDDGSHFFEALEVQVDGPAADSAAARHGDSRHTAASDQGAENQRAGTHRLDDLVLGDRIGQVLAADRGAVLRTSVAELDLCTHGHKQFALGFNVLHLRDVLEGDFVFGENGCGHAGKRGVLGSGNTNCTDQRVAAAHDKFVHRNALLLNYQCKSG